MNELIIAKAVLTGIFTKAYDDEFGSMDDEYFIPVVRAGIESAEKSNPGIFDELLKHTIEEYTRIWLRNAEKDEDEFDEIDEREIARETFLDYFYENEF